MRWALIYALVFLRRRSTTLMIPANLTIVPGAGMYRIVYYILRSEHEMSSYYFQQTILAAGMIAVAIFIVNIILEKVFSTGKMVQSLFQERML